MSSPTPSPDPAPRPHLTASALGVVFVGGTVGTAAREALGLTFPAVDGAPVGILVANLVGAFLLGVLLEALVRRGGASPRGTRLRLLLGTGFLGGFTTYSALTTHTALLLGEGRSGVGLGYALATVLVGALATWAGIAVAAAAVRPAQSRTRPAPGGRR